MKKTFIFGLLAAALGFTACSSEDDLSVNDNNQKKGMVLRATVEQPAESRASISDDWHFAFDEYDEIRMTNSEIGYDNFYTFEHDGTNFVSEDAKATKSEATWHAYFPAEEFYFGSKTGLIFDVALQYALAGSATTTGKGGLAITMKPKVAILEINNQKGEIDINVKNSSSTWVVGLTANNTGGFDVLATFEKESLLKLREGAKPGIYYVAVPAGIQLAIKDGDKTIASTGEKGLKAGCYYELTIEAAAPEGALSGKFNVSDTKQVYFAKGNLYYDGSAFQLEENQYDIATSWSTSTPHVSNFFWSKDAAQAYASSCSYETVSSVDDVFFTNADEFTVNGQTNVWRTLSNDEWNYLFSNYAYKYTTVCGKKGLVIAPTSDATTIADSYDTTAWATAEANGFVFLPNTGYRSGTGISETNKSCIYWSSTLTTTDDGTKPYRKFFQWDGTKLSENFYDATLCNWGIGIRLVADVQ